MSTEQTPESTSFAPQDEQAAPRTPEVTLADELRVGSVLVAATDASDSDGAVTVAYALEQRYGTRVLALQVLDISQAPMPAPLASVFTLARDLIGDAPYAADALARRRHFSDLLGAPNEWPVHIALGTPAREILRHAEQHGVALVTMGLRRHGLMDRVLRDETTLTVARHARATVLGIVPELRGLPRRAVVGVDFGPASSRAARAALDVLARPVNPGGALLRLAYVAPEGERMRESTAGEALIRRMGVDAAFADLVRTLDAPSTVRVDCTTLEGTTADALLAFASESEADLIAVGSLRHERVERLLLGSVTTAIVRDGRCSVLVVPP